MFIEDIISLVAKNIFVGINAYDQKILRSFHDQLFLNSSLTEKQGKLSVVILKKHLQLINQELRTDISKFLENPSFKNPFRTINYNRFISIQSDPIYKKVIKIEFPFDEEIITYIREQKSKIHFSTWKKEEKSWIFSLTEENIQLASSLKDKFNFKSDESFSAYIDQIKIIKENLHTHIPMASLIDDKIKFINVSAFTPQNQSNDFLESLFFAKKVGINVWDENIEEKISQLPYDKQVISLIKNDPDKQFEIYLNDTPLETLIPVIIHMLPCLVVISDGNEMEKLEYNYNFFKKAGIENNEMTVLFRLPSDSGSNFNEFVKINKLNSPLADITKVAFINSQIPKTIFNRKKEFNSVLNYNYFSAHYKLKDFLKWHQNVINILDKTPQRRLNFAIM